MFVADLYRQDNKLELRHTLEGHQLGVVSVDINSHGTCIFFIDFELWETYKCLYI